MTDQWLHSWFPLVGLMLQVILWGLIVPRFASRKTMAVPTFTVLPEEPDW